MSRLRYLACILRLRLLDGGISDEDEVTELEAVLDDGGGMLLFEIDCGFDSSSIHVRGKCCQVRPTFLQGNSTLSDEVSRGKRGVRWGKQIGCFGNVEGQKRMGTGYCEVQGTAHMLVDCDSVSPDDRGDDGMPPRLASIVGLE